MGLSDLFRRLDEAVQPQRWSSHPLERPPARWERWVATHTWQTALLAALIAGLSISTVWTLTDYQFQLNNFVLRAVIVGAVAFGVFAWFATNVAASVRVRDRLRDRNSASSQESRPQRAIPAELVHVGGGLFVRAMARTSDRLRRCRRLLPQVGTRWTLVSPTG